MVVETTYYETLSVEVDASDHEIKKVCNLNEEEGRALTFIEACVSNLRFCCVRLRLTVNWYEGTILNVNGNSRYCSLMICRL
jgi:hypothetical protein